MPVKKSSRRKQSTRPSARTRTPMRSPWRRMRAAIDKRWTHSTGRFASVAASMDRSTMGAVLAAGAIVLALLVAGHRTTAVSVSAANESPTITAAPEESRIATSLLPAAVNLRGVRSVRLQPDLDATNGAHVETPQLVTIAGCLAQDGETFRLKDTTGADAPRSRSWKSAFIHKGPTPVEVVDASHHLKLTNHVGERVSVTGTMVDGEMQVRSLHRIATSCNVGANA